MKLYRAAQMREADARAADAGVSTGSLMEAAGRAVSEALLRRYPDARAVAVLCGTGNNGGDGYVAARRLFEAGVGVRVYELRPTPDVPDAAHPTEVGAAAAARTAYLAAGGACEPLTAATVAELASLDGTATTAPVVIDALFGSGLSRPLSGRLAELVGTLGRSDLRVVAVDVPSGLDADSAAPIGPHLRADMTVELAGHKPAALFHPARAAFGEIVLVDIGMPPAVLRACSDVDVVTPELVRGFLPPRAEDAHKYDAGTVCVVAGSARYLGAAELACRGAWRGGAGLVTLVAPERLAGGWPETILEPHDWSSPWPPAALEPRRARACVIGPGLDPAALAHLPTLLRWAPGPVVLDAAALDPAALKPEVRGLLRARPALLTPHAGEAARLLGDAAPLLERDPLAAALRLSEAYGAAVVLKGPTTVVTGADGRQAVSTRGSAAMASGGTGDVLAGLLGALLAAPGGAEALFERACLGVWLHGVAGELAAAELGNALVATDLVERLPSAARTLGW